MTKGLKINDRGLVVYSTKVEQKTKDLMAALVTVGPYAGHRELIGRMITLLEKESPELFEKAGQLLELQGKGLE